MGVLWAHTVAITCIVLSHHEGQEGHSLFSLSMTACTLKMRTSVPSSTHATRLAQTHSALLSALVLMATHSWMMQRAVEVLDNQTLYFGRCTASFCMWFIFLQMLTSAWFQQSIKLIFVLPTPSAWTLLVHTTVSVFLDLKWWTDPANVRFD